MKSGASYYTPASNILPRRSPNFSGGFPRVAGAAGAPLTAAKNRLVLAKAKEKEYDVSAAFGVDRVPGTL